MIPVTTFRGHRFTAPKEHVSLESILLDIKSTKWKNKIEKCHVDLKHKDWLPCFTPTGTFSHRSIKGMDYYNGIICLDIDHVENPSELKEICKSLPWIHAAFITPSGKGLKVIVKTNATFEVYKTTEEKIALMFLSATKYPRDNRCKDIARVQFISYDPDLYYNSDSEIIEKEKNLIDVNFTELQLL